jgi:hypothetical protein
MCIYRHQNNEVMNSPSSSVSVHNFYKCSDLDIFKIICTNWAVSLPTETRVMDFTHASCPITSTEALRCYQLLSHYSCGKRPKPKALFSLSVCSMHVPRTLSVHSRSHKIFFASIQMYLSRTAQCSCALICTRVSLLWEWAIELW